MPFTSILKEYAKIEGYWMVLSAQQAFVRDCALYERTRPGRSSKFWLQDLGRIAACEVMRANL